MDDREYQLEALKIEKIEVIRAIAQEIRESFKVGFEQAVEFYRTMTQPQIIQGSERPINPDVWPEDDDLAPGILDMRTLNEMAPTARAAVLAAHGLQQYTSPAAEYDPTADNLNQAIREDGLEPPASETIKEEEEE